MLVLVPGEVVGTVDISPVPGLWNIKWVDLVPSMRSCLLLTILEVDLWNSTTFILLLWLSRLSWNSWLFKLLGERELVSLILSPGILDGGPSTVSFDSNIVDTSDNTNKTIFTEMSTP